MLESLNTLVAPYGGMLFLWLTVLAIASLAYRTALAAGAGVRLPR